MELEKLLSSPERIMILERIMFMDHPFSVTGVASELGLSKGLVSKFLAILVKQKILSRDRLKFQVRPSTGTLALKIMFNLNRLDPEIFKKYRSVLGVGIYGSKVKGTDNESSDLDIYIIVSRYEEMEQSRLTRELRQRYGAVNPLYLSKEKIRQLKSENRTFYGSLTYGSITIYGDGIEAVGV